MTKYGITCISSICLMMGSADTALAQSTVSDPIKRAVKTIHGVDATGQAFTLSIAAVGGAGAISLGTWLLYDRPLASRGKPSPLLFTNGLLMVSTGIGQFVHGFMRLGERRASTRAARSLLDNPKATQQEYLNYLKYRADQSEYTRFIGAVITTLQGVVGMAVGLELALVDASDYKATGWTIAGLSVIGTGIGAIHFFGDTRARRELNAALKLGDSSSRSSFELTPVVLSRAQGQALPGIMAFGRF